MATTEPKVLQGSQPGKRAVVRPWSEEATYRVVGWAGALLALAALCDYALAFYPLGFGSAEWEMATIGSVVQGLPLLSIGLAALWVCAARLAWRAMLVVVGAGGLILAACVFVSLLLFVTDVPLAVRATQSVARLGIYKLVARTLILGLMFGTAYAVMGVMALKRARGTSSGERMA